ncbi:ComEA family DNA-binding protein [Rhodothermus profundi]|uniref:Helix-hairpin-helix motif-containing protein n=1 Tax=Rhodothermus profundi TaxID=633813 RepID=A0A1M6SZ13_9BACT|nr:helix-hairpin-helix domain-containing protein [Rhodothermus profundi]SHK49951.1 Helix-hairpin-helix motif-containing protein [Rhodothermus profundi]
MRPCVLILLLLPMPVAAQRIAPDTLSSLALVEAALEGITLEPAALEALVTWLEERRRDPLNLNTASAAELSQLPGLSPQLARQIVRHRRRHGPFTRLSDLLLVEGFSASLLHRLRPFVTVRPEQNKPTVSGYVLQRLDYLPHQTDKAYPGLPVRLQTRLRLRYGHLETALTLENDPGEPFRWDPATHTYGFDHLAGFVAWRSAGRLRQLIAGDFSARFGSGLTLWSLPTIDSYQAAVDAPLRQGSGLMPYSGTDENRYFRGLALTLAPTSTLMLSLFVSRRRLDARLDTLAASQQTGVVSLPTTGLHRTPAEQRRKGMLRNSTLGGALTVEHAYGQVGLVGYIVHFAPPLQRSPLLHNRHAWRGRTARTLGFFSQFHLGQALLSAEIGGTPGRPPGVVGALSGPLGRSARGTLACRYLPTRFFSPYGDPFDTRSGAPAGEIGCYAGLELAPAPGWQLSAAFDQYQLSWPRYGQFWPTTGRIHWLRLTVYPRPWLKTYLQFRYDLAAYRTEVPGPAVATFKATAPEHYLSLRWHGTYTFSPMLHLESRLEYAHRLRATSRSTGWLFYQGLRWRPSSWLQVDVRLTAFSSAPSLLLYVPEPGLRYSMSLAALRGQGQRALLRLQLRPLSHLLLQLRHTKIMVETMGWNIQSTWQFLLLWQIG